MKQGFSLVELSIVLVILGLLTGGVLTGQSLIRAAELRSVTTEYEKYAAAVHTFRDKYFALPGDFRDATRFWSRAASTADCVTNSAAAVVSTGSCDGDGDGIITNASAGNASGERFQFWKQLALAGLIEGTYTGLAGSGGVNHAVIGTNVPKAKLTNAGWDIHTYTYSANGVYTDRYYLNALRIGATTAGMGAYNPILKPEEVWNIDTKMDDGKPQQGKVWAIWWDTCTTATSSSDLNGSYDLTNTSIDCAVTFLNAF